MLQNFLKSSKICLIVVSAVFFSVLCFFNDQVYFYITHLELLREDHARLYSLTMLFLFIHYVKVQDS